MKRYEREFAGLAPEEKEATMELTTSWERKGREAGRQERRQEGKEELVARQITQRFGTISSQAIQWLDQLSAEQLNDLGVALLDFASAADLDNWITQQNRP